MESPQAHKWFSSSCYSDVVCPFRSYLAIHNFYLVTGGVGERVDPTGDSEKNKSGSAEERESSCTEGLDEYETEYEEEEVHCSKN